jgi:hypothetical protein
LNQTWALSRGNRNKPGNAPEESKSPMSTPSLALNNLPTLAVPLEAAGATLRYLPRYSSDLNPIEMPFRKFNAYLKLKAYLRKLAERNVPGVHRAIVPILGMLLEIGGVALCTGNPAYASEVGLACHPVWETFDVASHCGLFIFAGREIRAQYSLGLFGTTFNTDPAIMQADRTAFFKGPVYAVRAPQGETQESFEKSVVAWANRYRASHYDLIIGPNSNSAVAFPLIMSGAEPPNVQQGMLGALGLGYWSFLRDPAAGSAAAPHAAVVRKAQRNPCTQCRFAEAARNRGRARRAGTPLPR